MNAPLPLHSDMKPIFPCKNPQPTIITTELRCAAAALLASAGLSRIGIVKVPVSCLRENSWLDLQLAGLSRSF